MRPTLSSCHGTPPDVALRPNITPIAALLLTRRLRRASFSPLSVATDASGASGRGLFMPSYRQRASALVGIEGKDGIVARDGQRRRNRWHIRWHRWGRWGCGCGCSRGVRWSQPRRHQQPMRGRSPPPRVRSGPRRRRMCFGRWLSASSSEWLAALVARCAHRRGGGDGGATIKVRRAPCMPRPMPYAGWRRMPHIPRATRATQHAACELMDAHDTSLARLCTCLLFDDALASRACTAAYAWHAWVQVERAELTDSKKKAGGKKGKGGSVKVETEGVRPAVSRGDLSQWCAQLALVKMRERALADATARLRSLVESEEAKARVVRDTHTAAAEAAAEAATRLRAARRAARAEQRRRTRRTRGWSGRRRSGAGAAAGGRGGEGVGRSES